MATEVRLAPTLKILSLETDRREALAMLVLRVAQARLEMLVLEPMLALQGLRAMLVVRVQTETLALQAIPARQAQALLPVARVELLQLYRQPRRTAYRLHRRPTTPLRWVLALSRGRSLFLGRGSNVLEESPEVGVSLS